MQGLAAVVTAAVDDGDGRPALGKVPETVTAELFRPDMVASDLDGTLLSPELEASPRSRRSPPPGSPS
jgi:hypothetical protein